MKIGDTFSDGQKRTWTVGECLGRGIWGRSFLVRDPDGHERVLKIALGPEDFPSDAALPAEVPKACRDALAEQVRLLEKGELPFLPKLEGKITLADGRPGFLLPRYNSTLGRKLEAGMPLTGAIHLVQRVATAIARAGKVHGNLRPSNILLNERGEPVLADVLTPAAERLLGRLEAFSNQRPRWRPPEAQGVRASAMWDTWAMCQVLWQSAMTRDASGGGAHRLELPIDGLDKVAIATLKDRALSRLASERTNARFRGRLTERLGSVLNRGLSRAAEPSPPYRFTDATSLLPRLDEVTALIAPRVEEVGRVLLASAADTTGTFQGGEGVGFVVSIGSTPGVTDHDDVVCGLQLVDLDAAEDGRVPISDAHFKVTTHPSGRMRFQFSLPKVRPGRYRVKAAFTIKDSGQEPQVADGTFEVRPPPGYVPPAEQVETRNAPISIGRNRPRTDPREEARPSPRIHAPIGAGPDKGEAGERPDLDDEDDDESEHDPIADLRPELASDPGAEIIEGLFPRPIAPPEDDASADLDENPTVEHTSVPVVVEVEETEASFATASGYPGRITSGSGPVAFAGGVQVSDPSQARPARPALAMPRPGIQVGSNAGPQISSNAGPRLTNHVMAHAAMSGQDPVSSTTSGPRMQVRPAAHAPLEAVVQVEDEDWESNLTGWDTVPSDGIDFGIDQEALPHAEGEDLPSWRRAELPFDTSAIPGLDRLVHLVKRDSYSAFVAAVAGCFVLLLACMALLRAC